MDISKTHKGETLELKITGRLDGYWANHLSSVLEEEIRHGSHHVLLDLSSVSFLSSAGIGVLVRFYKELESLKGSFGIQRASDHVWKILEISALRGVLSAKPPVMRRTQSATWLLPFGLGISNGLIALAGALLAQYQGFADVQMGIGMVVWGLASVIIGEALVGTPHQLGLAIAGTVMGTVFFRLLVAIALRVGLDPNDLKLVTAAFVFVALISPGLLKKMRSRKGGLHHA